MSSACNPLAPLQRWITYTQSEVLQIKRELYEYRQEVRQLKRSSSSSWTPYNRSYERVSNAFSELIEAVTELFQRQNRTQDLLVQLLVDFASLRVQSQAPKVS